MRDGNFALLLAPTSGAKLKVFEQNFDGLRKNEIAILLTIFKHKALEEESSGRLYPLSLFV